MRDLPRYFALTGGIASGKSTVARMFEELGARIIDADRVGHELLRAPLPAYQKIVENFGRGILDPSGEIDRRRLGALVFADPARLRELNAIVHPLIIERVEELAAAEQARDRQAVILVDAALTFEAGIGGNFSKVIVAWCSPEQQIERLVAKAGISREEAGRRIAAQIPAEAKRRRADYRIDCSRDLASTRAQVAAVYPELEQLVSRNWTK
jgi:dephospho-CoA kinase